MFKPTFLLLCCCIVFALFSNVNAQLTWDSCGEDGFKLNSVSVSPETPVVGQKVTISADADFEDSVSAGKVHATVHFGFIKLYDDTVDLCGLSPEYSCPFSGSMTVQQTAEVPKLAPAGKYKGKVLLTNQDNKQFGCFTFTLHLNRDSAAMEEHPSGEAMNNLIDQSVVDGVFVGNWSAAVHPLFSRLSVADAQKTLLRDTSALNDVDEIVYSPSKQETSVPQRFDARLKWPHCMLSTASTDAVEDRFCIGASDGFRPAEGMKYRRRRLFQGETAMMNDIMQNGPLEASINMYQDIFGYQSGVYHHLKGAFVGRHTVKVIGWDVDPLSKQRYWIVENTLGSGWGMNGYAWILRGSNECQVETTAIGGEPDFFPKY